jgi:CelD/BcsL family acetyltransferase involved in cellulose biosynthesis
MIESDANGGATAHRLYGFDDLDRIAAAWDGLAKRSGSPTERYSWILACAESLREQYELRFLVVGPPDRPVAIAPLARRRRPLAPLELLGVDTLREPMDLIYADADGAASLADTLAGLNEPIRLTRVPAESRALAALVGGYKRRGVTLKREAGSCPYIRLDQRWLEPEQVLSSRRRSDLRRARRRAERLGGVRCEVLSPGTDELDSPLAEAFRIESAGWKGKAQTALTHDRTRGEFFKRYAEAAAAEGILRLCFLRIGDRGVAMQLAVEVADGFWLLKIGYDQEFGGCSPGSLLLEGTIRYAAERKLRSYEFLGRADSWTRVWTRDERPCVQLQVYPFRPRGMTRLAADAAVIGLRRVRERVGARG